MGQLKIRGQDKFFAYNFTDNGDGTIGYTDSGGNVHKFVPKAEVEWVEGKVENISPNTKK